MVTPRRSCAKKIVQKNTATDYQSIIALQISPTINGIGSASAVCETRHTRRAQCSRRTAEPTRTSASYRREQELQPGAPQPEQEVEVMG